MFESLCFYLRGDKNDGETPKLYHGSVKNFMFRIKMNKHQQTQIGSEALARTPAVKLQGAQIGKSILSSGKRVTKGSGGLSSFSPTKWP